MDISLTGYENPVTTTVGAFLANLPELLGAMSSEPEHYVLVGEFSDGRYVQFWSDAVGSVNGEVLSNLNIGEAVALSPEDEEQLKALGFEEPVEYLNPNWSMEASTAPERTQLITAMAKAVQGVLCEGPRNAVSIRTWKMTIPKDSQRDDVRRNARIYLDE